VHRVDEAEAFLNAALVQGGLDLGRDVDEPDPDGTFSVRTFRKDFTPPSLSLEAREAAPRARGLAAAGGALLRTSSYICRAAPYRRSSR